MVRYYQRQSIRSNVSMILPIGERQLFLVSIANVENFPPKTENAI